mmetsp:Transcript_39101/g.94530  ORF Transcript_39101/g.94530 Transcript_39101/m.94530 type:complete len:336 (+) Transcript_39101:50-1057(+)
MNDAKLGKKERFFTHTSFGYASRRHGILPTLLFLGSLGLLSSIIPAFNQQITQKTSTTTSSADGTTSSCRQQLDKLEDQFNRQRQARINSMLTLNLTMTKRTQRFDVFEPEALCIADERFGSDIRYHAFGDGPKFVCGVDFIGNKKAKKPQEECLVYSIGSDNDIQFEKAVHTFLQCETHTFDPTLNEEFKGSEYSTFHPWGIGADGEMQRVRKHNFVSKSIHTIMTELGHTNRTIDILKIDCEGCEYESMPAFFDLIASKQIRVNQIQIELHIALYEKVLRLFMAADKAGMRVFHKERNGWGCAGHRCLEYSFVSESFLRQVNGAMLCGEPFIA